MREENNKRDRIRRGRLLFEMKIKLLRLMILGESKCELVMKRSSASCQERRRNRKEFISGLGEDLRLKWTAIDLRVNLVETSCLIKSLKTRNYINKAAS